MGIIRIHLAAVALFLAGSTIARSLAAAPLEEKSIWIAETCQGADEKSPCLSTPVSKNNPTTWQTVLAQIAPGIRLDQYHHMAAESLITPSGILKDAGCDFADSVNIHQIQAYRAPDSLLTILNTPSCVILGLFSDQAPYPLIASYAIGSIGGPEMGGMAYYFDEFFQVAPKAWVMEVLTLHANSNEQFVNHLFFLYDGKKLQPVYDGPSLLSYHTEKESVAFHAKLKLLPMSQGPYRDIAIEVTETRNKKLQKRYPWTIAWDAGKGKYMGGNKELLNRIQELMKLN